MIKKDDTPNRKQNRKQSKTSYYLRFHESGRINSSRFHFSSSGNNDADDVDSGQTAQQTLQDSKRFITASSSRTSKVISYATGKDEKKSAAISQNNSFRLKRGSTRGSSFNSSKGENSSLRMRGSITASDSSKKTTNIQKQHIKKEYQKKAIAAIATAAAPETAAISAATKAAQSIPSKNKDGAGKFLGIIVAIFCCIPILIAASFIYTVAFVIEPVAQYLDERIEEYKSGFAGDGSSDIIIDASQSPVPADALNDPEFAALITEAEKYLGYPYVWGGSSPSTSFDCSGFVCWVYSQSGVYELSRMTAQNIYYKCTIITAEDVRPGDLVFFTDTYSASYPVTHVGIYTGNSYMIHAGDPIQYTSINTPYWTDHFYAYGRLTD